MNDSPSSGTPPLFDPGLPPSAALLVYLFADRWLPASRLGTKTPLSGIRVNSDALAVDLLAVSFWQLRQSGLIRLESGRDGLRVFRTDAPEEPRRDSTQGGILDVLTPGSGGRRAPAWEAPPGWLRSTATRSTDLQSEAADLPNLPEVLRTHGGPQTNTPPLTVREAVMRWYGEAVHSPESVPIKWAEREAIGKGYITTMDAGRNPLAALFLGKKVQPPVASKVAAAGPAFEVLKADWQAFRAGEASFHGQLGSEVAAGIAASHKTSGGSST